MSSSDRGDGSNLEPGGLILDDYLIERRLGRGGFGTVFLVRSRAFSNRFALKTIHPHLHPEPRLRRGLLQELIAWSELPKHPNLTELHFFRTIQDRILIFAEYVDGGSLGEWIKGRRISEPVQVLDVAIQTIRGLRAAHARGVVHRDIKPGNILLTESGVAKITDFGLARVRGVGLGGVAPDHSSETSSRPSDGDCTPAYCSPEQADGSAIGFPTDVWSWGLTILSILRRGSRWLFGPEAPELLEEAMTAAGGIPIPDGLVEILRRCFLEDPAHRWPDLGELEERLTEVYRETAGQDYPRPAPPPVEPLEGPTRFRRSTSNGVVWDDPRPWLEKACVGTSENIDTVRSLLALPAVTQRGRILADLVAFEEARRLWQEKVAAGVTGGGYNLAKLQMIMAVPLREVGDLSGATGLYQGAIELLEAEPGPTDPLLFKGWLNQAGSRYMTGDREGAVALCDRALEAMGEEPPEGREDPLAEERALAWEVKSVVLGSMGDQESALACSARAIEWYENRVDRRSRPDLDSHLASLCTARGDLLAQTGDTEALEWMERGVRIYRERLGAADGGPYAPMLAAALINQALQLSNFGRGPEAMEVQDRAVAILKPLVAQGGRLELADKLAMVLMNKAISLCMAGRHPEAMPLFDQVIGIRERLVHQEGRRASAGGLATAYTNKAFALVESHQPEPAIELYRQAEEILERLVREGTSVGNVWVLACALRDRARALDELGRDGPIEPLYDRSLELLTELVEKRGQVHYQADRAMARAYRADHLARVGALERATREARSVREELRVLVEETSRVAVRQALAWVEENLKELL